MENVNAKISSLIKTCDVLLYHKHLKNYGINAFDIHLNAPKMR